MNFVSSVIGDIIFRFVAAAVISYALGYVQHTYDQTIFDTVEQAKAQEQAPLEIYSGKPYDEVRKSILKDGWQPSKANHELGFQAQALSKKYPEVQNCAGTGTAPCTMKFVNDRGYALEVDTVGEERLTVIRACRNCEKF